MADYTSTRNSILGSDYCAGLVSGCQDYVIMPISDTQTVVLQGDFSKASSDRGSEIEFSGERWIVERSSDGGYGSYYDSDYTPSVECTLSIKYPYYCRGNLTDMSVIDSRRDDVIGNFSVTFIMWGLLICVTLYSLLRSCLRSRY